MPGIKEVLAGARSAVAAAIYSGAAAGAGGVQACGLLSDELDTAVRRLWAEGPPPGGAQAVALLATGGWGRRETCPWSDIDLLFLTSGPPEGAREAADRILYPLWDSGLEVGHAVRSLPEAIALAQEDLATATALLDARLLAGDPGLAQDLERELLAALSRGGDANAFVRKLVEEKAERHARFEDTLYLLEPNVKHGQGGLRDLATGLWAARARWRVRDFAPLVGMGQASMRQAQALTAARDFLLRVRAAVHLHAKRRLDQLTFETQEAVAPRFFPQARVLNGEVRPAVAPAVEELMRSYYLHAKTVVRETDRLLERAVVPPRRPPSVYKMDGTWVAWNGQLSVEDPQIFRDRPAEMVRIFSTALDYQLPLYGHTREVIAELVAADPGRLWNDLEARSALARLLCDPRDKRQPSLLEQAHELGVVSAIMPEFAPCTGRVQHDLYHVFTVDQHQLYAVALLKRIARGELAREAPAVTRAALEVEKPRSLYLGTLLHDVGKPLGKGHSEKGARLADAIARRLGFTDEEVARTTFLVRHHLLMSHLSQRRDLDDVEMIGRFARTVKDEETLRALYVLTYCDTAMTAPGNLTEWKASLLRQLYERTRAVFSFARLRRDRRGPDLAGADRSMLVKRRRRKLAELGPDVDRWLAGMPDRYFAAEPPANVARHLRLSLRRGDRPVALAVTHHARQEFSELVVAAADAPGLLMRVTGVLLANRMDVAGARIHSRAAVEPGDQGEALDVFLVRDRYGRAIPPDDPRWKRVEEDLAAVVAGRETVEALVASRRESSKLAGRVTPEVRTEIEIDNEVSNDFTVVDVYTQDRIGVLYAITRTLTELALDIGLSKVATEAARVADVFYVRDRETGAKVMDPGRLAEIERSLRAALAELPG